ncbi:hypothetical protein CV_2652 [Chromobacterium violaceum ATCC 12472]|uniref:Uncharacterized protein n=1 Tax=Chromobacterium violaceum (strain ATCC 12472 / DSM 30191 / JCM 1249 / CCUG 213 / NBRC 12614 / NCIMB 9131 / NCTC 9757 / MK) TaxID=243365 RepID=Q7NUP5_CHRVO|nr:hypothetical protein CV_2652 [Chromobacterium violaceum ATCC 12472]
MQPQYDTFDDAGVGIVRARTGAGGKPLPLHEHVHQAVPRHVFAFEFLDAPVQRGEISSLAFSHDDRRVLTGCPRLRVDPQGMDLQCDPMAGGRGYAGAVLRRGCAGQGPD